MSFSKIEFVVLKGGLTKMTKKLNDLLLKKDTNGRQIRCVVVEDEVTGITTRVRGQENIELALETASEEFVTKVYEPTFNERMELLELIKNSITLDEAGEPSIEISEEKVFLTMLEHTDIKVDKRKNKTNEKIMQQLLANPSAVFIAIKQELESILLEIVSLYYTMIMTQNQIASDMNRLQSDIISLQNVIEKQEIEKKEKIQEIDEIEAYHETLEQSSDMIS